MTSKPRILVIDDHDEWRDRLVECLSDDYIVDAVMNVKSAKQALRQTQYAVVTVDLNLVPGQEVKDGHELLWYIRKNHMATQCIVISGSVETRKEVRDLLKNKGAFDFMGKGNEFEPDEFLRMVEAAIKEFQVVRDKIGNGAAAALPDEPRPSNTGISIAGNSNIIVMGGMDGNVSVDKDKE